MIMTLLLLLKAIEGNKSAISGWHDGMFAIKIISMKNYTKMLFSILAAVICTAAFAADKPSCKKSGKNCPMNDNKECKCGKSCDCK
jgi:hypothetical protein